MLCLEKARFEMVAVCAQMEQPAFFSSVLWRKYKLFLWIASIASIAST